MPTFLKTLKKSFEIVNVFVFNDENERWSVREIMHVWEAYAAVNLHSVRLKMHNNTYEIRMCIGQISFWISWQTFLLRACNIAFYYNSVYVKNFCLCKCTGCILGWAMRGKENIAKWVVCLLCDKSFMRNFSLKCSSLIFAAVSLKAIVQERQTTIYVLGSQAEQDNGK